MTEVRLTLTLGLYDRGTNLQEVLARKKADKGPGCWVRHGDAP